MERKIASLALLLVFTLSSGTARAQQDDYPNRPVHILAAAAPGGNPGVLARLLSQQLSEVLGQPFVVENVPGAGGILAAKRVAASAPDGYMLMVNDSGALAINITLSADATYTLKDFTPITALATVPTALVIIPSVPAETLNEFIALAKSNPGTMNFGSAGAGSIHRSPRSLLALISAMTFGRPDHPAWISPVRRPLTIALAGGRPACRPRLSNGSKTQSLRLCVSRQWRPA
jgi:tripartite-type tricarboxylate transporter receptor subunit TctC